MAVEETKALLWAKVEPRIPSRQEREQKQEEEGKKVSMKHVSMPQTPEAQFPSPPAVSKHLSAGRDTCSVPFFVEMGSCYVAQDDFILDDLPASVSRGL